MSDTSELPSTRRMQTNDQFLYNIFSYIENLNNQALFSKIVHSFFLYFQSVDNGTKRFLRTLQFFKPRSVFSQSLEKPVRPFSSIKNITNLYIHSTGKTIK